MVSPSSAGSAKSGALSLSCSMGPSRLVGSRSHTTWDLGVVPDVLIGRAFETEIRHMYRARKYCRETRDESCGLATKMLGVVPATTTVL